jgi:hypothetical protein
VFQMVASAIAESRCRFSRRLGLKILDEALPPVPFSMTDHTFLRLSGPGTRHCIHSTYARIHMLAHITNNTIRADTGSCGGAAFSLVCNMYCCRSSVIWNSVNRCFWLDRNFLSRMGLVESNPGPDEETNLDRFTCIRGIKIFSQNVNRILSGSGWRIDYLGVLCAKFTGPVILGCLESWLTPSADTALINIPNMSCIRLDSPDKSMGMVIYHSLQLTLFDADHSADEDYAMFSFKVRFEGSTYVVCFLYRPPREAYNARFFGNFQAKLENLTQNFPKNLIILGDLNFNLLHVPLPAPTRRLSHLFTECGLVQQIQKPTRRATYGDNVTVTLIDHIYTSGTEMDHKFELFNNDEHVSDHNCIGLCLVSIRSTMLRSHKHHYETVRDFNKIDIDRTRNLLDRFDWSTVEQTEDIEIKWSEFTRSITSILNNTSGTKRVKTCIDCHSVTEQRNVTLHPWYDKELKDLKNTCCKWLKAYRITGFRAQFLEYKLHLKLFNKKIRYKSRNYSRKLIVNATNPAEMHKIVQKLRGKTKQKMNAIEKITFNGNTYTHDKGKASLLNEFFTSVGIRSAEQAGQVIPDIIHIENAPRLRLEAPSHYQLFKYLYNLKEKKPAGPDKIPPSFYKTFAHSLVAVLHNIFSACIAACNIPRPWKQAHVTPIFKKGDKSDPSNYRPISITSVIAKVFERAIYDQLVQHFEANLLFNDAQYGYRRGRSTFHAIADATETIRQHANSVGAITGAVFLDLSKAFDCVNHRLLCLMLSCYGLDVDSVSIIKNFLVNRKQVVKLNGVLSEERGLVCGVPQGSLLGPYLFDIYVNFLPLAAPEAHVVQYADDTVCIRSNVNFDQLKSDLGNDLNNIKGFLTSLGLQLNLGKTEFLIFGTPPANWDTNLYLDGQTIVPVAQAKYLGVTIDNNLKFDEHNKHVFNKFKTGNFLIRTIRPKITLNVAKHLLHVLIYSYHDYACPIWEKKSNSRFSQLLEKQHRFALKSVFRKGWEYPSERIYKLSQLPSLHCRRNVINALFTHAILEHSAPARFRDFVSVCPFGRGFSTRRLVIPAYRVRTELVNHSLKKRSALIWNCLRPPIRIINDKRCFKRTLKRSVCPPHL